MTHVNEQHYILDLPNRSNWSCIESARLGKTIMVLVRPEDDAAAKTIVAKGIRSADDLFTVVVSTPEGEESHSWYYSWLLEAIKVHKPDA